MRAAAPRRVRISPPALRLAAGGAQRVRGEPDAAMCRGLMDLLAEPPADQAGVGVFGVGGLHNYLRSGGAIGPPAFQAAALPSITRRQSGGARARKIAPA